MDAAIKAIAEPRRREILRLVWDVERSSGEIASQFDITGPAVSQHLKVVPTALDAGPGEIRRQIWIDAPVEVVFSYFTDPAKHVRWQGTAAEIDPRPGGHLRLSFVPGYVSAGTYLEVTPPTRLVYTW